MKTEGRKDKERMRDRKKYVINMEGKKEEI